MRKRELGYRGGGWQQELMRGEGRCTVVKNKPLLFDMKILDNTRKEVIHLQGDVRRRVIHLHWDLRCPWQVQRRSGEGEEGGGLDKMIVSWEDIHHLFHRFFSIFLMYVYICVGKVKISLQLVKYFRIDLSRFLTVPSMFCLFQSMFGSIVSSGAKCDSNNVKSCYNIN